MNHVCFLIIFDRLQLTLIHSVINWPICPLSLLQLSISPCLSTGGGRCCCCCCWWCGLCETLQYSLEIENQFLSNKKNNNKSVPEYTLMCAPAFSLKPHTGRPFSMKGSLTLTHSRSLLTDANKTNILKKYSVT
jgi:hypothetical protein